MPIAHLPARAVLEVTGEDRVAFLQGLVSNDVALAAPGRAVWSALLSPQGKWIADFFIFAEPGRLLLDVEAGQAVAITQRLTRFRLRARVTIAPTPLAVHVAWGAAAGSGRSLAISAPDPRLSQAGWRLLAEAIATDSDAGAYDLHRIRLGLPDGSADMEADRSVLLEAGFDELNGVCWSKGCYMGQELTARTRYRGLVKRRLVPVHAETALPAPGMPVMSDGVEVGVLRSVAGRDGLALLRLAALAPEAALEAGGVGLSPRLPDWLRLPQAVSGASPAT